MSTRVTVTDLDRWKRIGRGERRILHLPAPAVYVTGVGHVSDGRTLCGSIVGTAHDVNPATADRYRKCKKCLPYDAQEPTQGTQPMSDDPSTLGGEYVPDPPSHDNLCGLAWHSGEPCRHGAIRAVTAPRDAATVHADHVAQGIIADSACSVCQAAHPRLTAAEPVHQGDEVSIDAAGNVTAAPFLPTPDWHLGGHVVLAESKGAVGRILQRHTGQGAPGGNGAAERRVLAVYVHWGVADGGVVIESWHNVDQLEMVDYAPPKEAPTGG